MYSNIVTFIENKRDNEVGAFNFCNFSYWERYM